MKKIVLILMALAIVSCQEKEGAKDDSGTAVGVKDGTKIFVSTVNKNLQPVPVDTAIVQNEAFTLNLPNSESQTINNLTVEGVRGSVVFINVKKPVKFQLYKDSLRTSTIHGGKHNALLTMYSNHLKDFGKKMNNLMNQFRDPATAKDTEKIAALQKKRLELINQNKAYKQNLVKENPGSIVSVMVLSDIVRRKSSSYPEMKKLYENLSEEVKNTSAGKAVESMLSTMSAVALGSIAPSFSGPTPTGDTLSLKDVMGEVTLIDFWASWCKPCRAENPNIVKVYEKYHDKGLNVIQVSLDKQKEKWVEAIEKDGLVWNHISHLQFWQDPIAKKYNVRAIPAAFLIDENGVIIAKDLRGEELEKKVAELLGS